MAKKWWMMVAGIVMGLLSAGVILLASKPPQGVAIVLRLPPSPVPVVVYVTGAVSEPGVYSLPVNSRVEDALQVAGGMTEEADINSVNLAALLQDGLEIHVSQKSKEFIPESGASSPAGEGRTADEQPATLTISYPININTASQAELESLPGIGPVTAQKIIEYRAENGFTIIEDIQKVSGIGPATFEKIKDFISVKAEK